MVCAVLISLLIKIGLCSGPGMEVVVMLILETTILAPKSMFKEDLLLLERLLLSLKEEMLLTLNKILNLANIGNHPLEFTK